MEFLVLGPLEIRRDGRPVEVGGSKRRALLALLILHANEVVRSDRLIDELWGGRSPANASAALQNHVSRLRKDLGGDVLVTKPWGYVLRADPQAIDLLRFETLVNEARTLAAHERRERLRQALALWRGPALADVASEPALTTEIGRLEELRLSALEQRIDTDLELSSDPELVAELETLVARHPLRERLRGQLILALYRAGRQAEALEAYRETRRALVEELGIEPSPELRELEQAILRQDPALVVAPPPPPLAGRADEPSSRWRWPRSPLAIAAALLFVAAAGAAAALFVSGGGPSEGVAAAPISTARSTTQATKPERPAMTTHTNEEQPPPTHGSRKSRTIERTTTAVTTQPHEQPADPPPSPPERPATVARTHAATTSTKPRSRPQQRSVYLLEDDFEDPALDLAMWTPVATNTDAGAAVERNGWLEFAINGGAVPADSSFGVHYGTQCTLWGDFDARVEFELLTWPDRNGVNVFLSPWFQNDRQVTFVGRTGQFVNGGAEAYTAGMRSYGTSTATEDSTGALRARRIDDYITLYYRHGGAWIPLATRYHAGVVRLLLGIDGVAGSFGRQPAVVAFDNFRATAPKDSLVCNGVPYPPRKPAP